MPVFNLAQALSMCVLHLYGVNTSLLYVVTSGAGKGALSELGLHVIKRFTSVIC
jgi:hypothetical protein